MNKSYYLGDQKLGINLTKHFSPITVIIKEDTSVIVEEDTKYVITESVTLNVNKAVKIGMSISIFAVSNCFLRINAKTEELVEGKKYSYDWTGSTWICQDNNFNPTITTTINTWDKESWTTNLSYGGTESPSKGYSDNLYIDTKTSGLWTQTIENEYPIQIGKDTTIYIPFVLDGIVTVNYQENGEIIYKVTSKDIKIIEDSKYVGIVCNFNDYIKCITYGYKEIKYAMSIQNNSVNINGCINLNGESIYKNIYPIGSIYYKVDNPSDTFGGSWTKFSDGNLFKGWIRTE